MDGYFIPKGVVVSTSSWAAVHDLKNYPGLRVRLYRRQSGQFVFGRGLNGMEAVSAPRFFRISYLATQIVESSPLRHRCSPSGLVFNFKLGISDELMPHRWGL